VTIAWIDGCHNLILTKFFLLLEANQEINGILDSRRLFELMRKVNAGSFVDQFRIAALAW
jgi:hypothetical protein